jgi:hypothetical protein
MNKVGGSLHFAPGKSYTRNGVHAHDLTQYIKSSEFDWTHQINDLRFGETVGFSNPLDGVKKKATGAWSKFDYFIKVVRTDFTYLNGSVISTNQFSVTEHDKVIPTILGMPSDMPGNALLLILGIFFTLDISPMLITYTEYQKPFSHFLTDTCAIVGGIFTMAGLIDGLIYTAEKKLGKKMDLGKAS